MFDCFHCGEKTVSWDADLDPTDYGYNCEGVIHELHCNSCGAQIVYELLDEQNG